MVNVAIINTIKMIEMQELRRQVKDFIYQIDSVYLPVLTKQAEFR